MITVNVRYKGVNARAFAEEITDTVPGVTAIQELEQGHREE